MTKEEILDNALPDVIEYPHYNLNNFQRSAAFDAMDEYAKIQSIQFLEWATGRNIEISLGVFVDDKGVYNNIDQYYSIFIEEQLNN